MLDHHMHHFLLTLERAVGWVNIEAFQGTPSATRSQAVKLGYVEAKGANLSRCYKITKAGYTALSKNAHEAMQEMIANGHVPPPPSPDRSAFMKTCVEPGCTEPRYKNSNRCEAHAKAKWREYSQRKPRSPKSFTPVGDPVVFTIPEPPIDQEDTIPPPFVRIMARVPVHLVILYYRLKGVR